MKGYTKKRDFYFYIFLFVVGLVALDHPWGFEALRVPDSAAYLSDHMRQGVVPVYPLFLRCNKILFGAERFLTAVIVEQIFLADISILVFIAFVRKHMRVNYAEAGLFFVFLLIPVLKFLRIGMASRIIVTEGIAYPAFLIMILFFLKSIWFRKWRYVAGVAALALVLALTRTQMQLCFIFPAVLIILQWMRMFPHGKKLRKAGNAALGCLIAVAATLLLFLGYQKGNVILQNVWQSLPVGNTESVRAQEGCGTRAKAKPAAGSRVFEGNIRTQFDTVMISKVLLTAKEEDAELFSDKEMRELYSHVYRTLKEDGYLLEDIQMEYLQPSELFGKLEGAYNEMGDAVYAYFDENPEQEMELTEVISEFLSVFLKNHPLRWLKGVLVQVPGGFISTVFVHVYRAYWVSWAGMLLVYGACVFLLLEAGRQGTGSEKSVTYLKASIFINIVMVGATCMLFIGLQRYLLYGFGTFYISLYLTAKQFVKRRFQHA